MASRTLTVSIVGDTSRLGSAFRKSGKEVDKSLGDLQKHVRGHMSGIVKSFAAGAVGVAGVAGAIDELKSSVHVFENLAKGTAMISRTTGMDTKVASEWVTVAKGRGVEAKQLNMGFVSLARNMKAASEGGKTQTKVFKELGVSHADLKRGNATEILKKVSDAFAKMPDGANKAAVAQKLFGRQASTLLPLLDKGSGALKKQLDVVDKYGATLDKGGIKKAQETIKAQRELGYAWQGVQIFLAEKLIPYIDKGAHAVLKFVGQMRDGRGVGGRFEKTLEHIRDKFLPIVKFFKDHPKLIAIAVGAWAAYKTASFIALNAVKVSNFRKVFAKSVPVAAEQGAKAGGSYAGAYSATSATAITKSAGRGGRIGGAMSRAGQIAGSAMGIAAALQFGVELAKGVEKTLQDTLPGGGGQGGADPKHHGVPGTGWNLFDFIKSKIGDGVGRITGRVKDALGGIGADGVLPSGGAFGGSLMGARPAMKPFAAIGSRFGLHVSSGRRPGAITSSGNVSWHSTGEAIDMADGRGPDAQKMGFFRYMKSHFGGRLAELIYGPGQVGIKDGRPYNFGPSLNAQHQDHVHVAFDSGRPGIGDGIGKRFTGDGYGYRDLGNLWIKAGGPVSQANTAAAVALAESGGDPNAGRNHPYHGLWQIGPGGPFGVMANARAAVGKWRAHGWQPWQAYTGADGRGSNGPWRHFLRNLKFTRPEPKFGPGAPQGFGQRIAAIDLEKADAERTPGLGDDIRALNHEETAKRRRLRRVRAALRRPQTREKRQQLTEEAGQLASDLAGIRTDLRDDRNTRAQNARTGPNTPQGYAGTIAQIGVEQARAKSSGSVKKMLTALYEEAFAKRTRLRRVNRLLRGRLKRETRQALNDEKAQLIDDLKSIGELFKEYSENGMGPDGSPNAAPDAPAGAADFANLAIAEAALTPGTGDDIAATESLLGIRAGELDAARKTGDPRKILEALDAWSAVNDSLKALKEAVDTETDARQRLIDELANVGAELKKNNEYASTLTAVGYREALKALADQMSGQIVGTNLQGRRQTAGTGALVRMP